MEKAIRTILIVGGLLTFGLALGFASSAGWATSLWPNPDDTTLSYRFVAAMQAAIAAAMLWIGLSGHLHLMAAGTLNLTVMFAGMGISLLRDDTLLGPNSQLYAAGCLVFAIFNVFLFAWAKRIAEPSQQPMPATVKWSFGVFVVALASVGALLINQTPEIMPWPLSPLTSVLFGWMFFADAFYFLFALIYPRWYNSVAQLWSFLAYDLILIGPFLARRSQVVSRSLPEEVWINNSITVYLAVLFFSLALGINYLILHPETGLIQNLRNLREGKAE